MLTVIPARLEILVSYAVIDFSYGQVAGYRKPKKIGDREMRMTLHQLRIFEAVARLLNVTAAAKELHVSQPAVSLQLKLLESEYGRQFFDRTNHGVALTDQGRAFLAAIQPALAQLNTVEIEFKAAARGQPANSLVVGANNTLTEIVLPEILTDFKKSHPDVQLVVQTANSPVMESYVLESKVDLALITIPSFSPHCVYEAFDEYEVVAFVSANSPIQDEVMSLDELVRHPLIVRRGTGCVKELVKRGYKLNFALECDAPETVISAVRRGLGLGLLFRARLDREIFEGSLRAIQLPELTNIRRRSFIIYDKRRPLTANGRDFIRALRNIGGPMRNRAAKNQRLEHSA
jgi:LysR family transcriptional regulator, transcriptional activator of the cysJI operon